MEILIPLGIFAGWFILTQILNAIIASVVNLPFHVLGMRGEMSSFIVTMISSIIVLFLGVKAFAYIGKSNIQIGIPIVMILSYYIVLGHAEKEGQIHAKASKNGAIIGAVIGTFLFNLI